MPDMSIRSMTPADALPIYELQCAYARAFEGASVLPGELYLSPAFHGGDDVFCAWQGERLLAYAPIYIQAVEDGPLGLPDAPTIAWIEIKAAPGLADTEVVKDALGARIAARLAQLAAHLVPRPLRLTFEYARSETPAVDYALSRGFQPVESVFHMRRDLAAALPERAAPAGVRQRRWKMETEAEQRAYLAARNACFPEAPLALDAWRYYMTSPQWAAGAMVAAFADGSLAGAVNVYWSDEENALTDPPRPFGCTEDIFVLPSYRGRGIAGAMIVEAMRFLQQHSLQEARLSVRALNEDALPLYRALGFAVHAESRFYARTIAPAALGSFSWGC